MPLPPAVCSRPPPLTFGLGIALRGADVDEERPFRQRPAVERDPVHDPPGEHLAPEVAEPPGGNPGQQGTVEAGPVCAPPPRMGLSGSPPPPPPCAAPGPRSRPSGGGTPAPAVR